MSSIPATLIALAVIGVTGAALLTGHASFDQFLGVAGSFGGVTGAAHLAGSLKTSSAAKGGP